MGYKRPVTIGLRKRTKDRLDRYRSSSASWDSFLNSVVELIEEELKRNHK